MKTFSLRSACLVSSVVLSFAWVGCGSSDSGGTTTTTDSGHPATDSGTFNVDSSTPTDSGVSTDSGVKTDSSTTDSSTKDSATTDSTASDSTATDSATSDSSTTDGGSDTTIGETSTDAGTDAPAGTTSGTKLVDGDVQLRTLTSDDQVLYLDRASSGGGLKAIPIGGGTATTLDATFDPTGASAVLADGKVAFVFDGLPAAGSPPIASLSIWSAANGLHSLSTNVYAGIEAATTDGTYVMYADNVASDGSTADLVLVKSDGTGKTTIFAGVDTSFSGSCAPSIQAAGSSFLVVHCTPTDTTQSVDVVSGAGAKTSISTDATQASTDAAGDKILVLTSAGALQLFAPTGGTPTAVDSGVAGGLLSNDGSTVVYFVSSGTTFTVKKTATSTIAPITISGGVVFDRTSGDPSPILAVTPSLSALVFASNAFDKSGTFPTSDINLLLTATASTAPVSILASGGIAGGIFGSAFTTDESYLLFYDSIDTTNGIGTLHAQPVSSTTAKTIGTLVWSGLAATGTKIVFNDNTDTTAFTADLRSVDVATTAAPTPIALVADLTFGLDHARDKVVYTTHSVAAPGLYVAPIP